MVHPLTVPVSGALRHTALLLHTPKYLHVYIFPSFIALSGACAIVFAKAKQQSKIVAYKKLSCEGKRQNVKHQKNKF